MSFMWMGRAQKARNTRPPMCTHEGMGLNMEPSESGTRLWSCRDCTAANSLQMCAPGCCPWESSVTASLGLEMLIFLACLVLKIVKVPFLRWEIPRSLILKKPPDFDGGPTESFSLTSVPVRNSCLLLPTLQPQHMAHTCWPLQGTWSSTTMFHLWPALSWSF